jgi:hypothetical protein
VLSCASSAVHWQKRLLFFLAELTVEILFASPFLAEPSVAALFASLLLGIPTVFLAFFGGVAIVLAELLVPGIFSWPLFREGPIVFVADFLGVSGAFNMLPFVSLICTITSLWLADGVFCTFFTLLKRVPGDFAELLLGGLIRMCRDYFK